MRVTMVMVSSVNGKITKGDNPNVSSWSSPEDAKFFAGLLRKNSLFVMGSNTYEAARQKIVLKPNKLRVVFTRNPDGYRNEEIVDQLEFTDQSPRAVVDRLEKRGYKNMFLLGGGTINGLFLEAGLVDEIYVTVEPLLFGTGKDLVAQEKFNMSLELMSVKQLNKIGTLLLKYKVIK